MFPSFPSTPPSFFRLKMSRIPWSRQINFASALLLHSCLTVLTKEACNAGVLFYRANLSSKRPTGRSNTLHRIHASAVLDAYTSIVSNDTDGELAELCFTNTGALLLSTTLAASVAMNLMLSQTVLNALVAGTFGVCLIASLIIGKSHFTLPITALRRAGRFIWADTPFVKFFTLIYIATVLRGLATLRLKDYVTFRCIAVLELIFMKAKIAASSPSRQERLMKRLIESERIILPAGSVDMLDLDDLPLISRDKVAAFQTSYRLSAMLFKTVVGYDKGCLTGIHGPFRLSLPAVGQSVTDIPRGLRICRPTKGTIVLADCYALQSQRGWWAKFLVRAHGVLLRKIGKVRVVYLVNGHSSMRNGDMLRFHSNVNLVTGVLQTWLDEFPEGQAIGHAVGGAP